MRMKTKTHSAKIYRWRFYCVAILLLVLAVALLFHLVKLQVLPNEHRGFEFLQGQGLARTLRTEAIPAYRGVITDPVSYTHLTLPTTPYV